MEEKLINSLKSFIELFIRSPYKYLSESDIKCGLYSELIKNYSDTFELISGDKFTKITGKNLVNLSQVTTEYHYFYENKESNKSDYSSYDRLDIAIINSEEKQTIDNINENYNDLFNSESFWIQPVKFGIEIKLSTYNSYPNLPGVRRDLEKLRDYYYSLSKTKNLIGISLCFCHENHEIEKYEKDYHKIVDVENILKIKKKYTL